VIALTNWRS